MAWPQSRSRPGSKGIGTAAWFTGWPTPTCYRQRFQKRALQGREKALGHEQTNTYIPALDTMQDLVGLFAR